MPWLLVVGVDEAGEIHDGKSRGGGSKSEGGEPEIICAYKYNFSCLKSAEPKTKYRSRPDLNLVIM